MAEATVISIRDVAMDWQKPATATHKEIQYRIDASGPFVLHIPLAQYSTKAVQEELGRRLKEWSDVVGIPIKGK